MPNANGQYQLQDYVAELQSRGFDGYSVSDLQEYTNRGYRRIARQTRWLWEQGTMSFNLVAGGAGSGAAYYDLSLVPTFGSLKKLYITTANLQTKLEPIPEERFFQYLGRDLTSASNQGIPTGYRIFDNRLYVFPTPSQGLSFIAYISQKVAKLVANTDVPLTPPEYDDAVITSALIYCHERAHEWDIVSQLKEELAEVFDNAFEDEVFEDEEEQERVSPDNTWL